MMKLSVITAILITLTTSLGCTAPPDFDSVYQRLDSPALAAGSDIPQPKQDAILTVAGKIGNPNQDKTVLMDRPTLESVGLIEYAVTDPFEETERTFTGVLIKDLLALWKVSPDAKFLHVKALNDFQVDIPIELVRDFPVMLALKQDGEYMEPDYRGPAMIVFPYGYYKFTGDIDAYWVWQVKSITVK
jgi:hypothetical protein